MSELSDEEAAAFAASSLDTPLVRAVAAQTSDEDVAEVMERRDALRAAREARPRVDLPESVEKTLRRDFPDAADFPGVLDVLRELLGAMVDVEERLQSLLQAAAGDEKWGSPAMTHGIVRYVIEEAYRTPGWRRQMRGWE